jgi:UDP-N-acetylglucosamine--N-acetylmuramyl-(pentapeptide) pyrophosphoryl-undecaprenol N-acetylglucosamine transferase
MNVVIAAGGTGGHVYPAVALAQEFQRQRPGTMISFVGTSRGIERKVLAHEGFELDLIGAQPVMGKRLLDALKGLVALPRGLWQSIGIVRRRRADLVVGIGGYSSPPVIAAAFLLGVPRVILEPNAYPGMANKAVASLANRVFLAYEQATPHFDPTTVRVVGTPVRRGFLDALAADSPAKERGEGQTLLVFGGSQGAHAINLAMIAALPHLMAREGWRTGLRMIHQTGEADCAEVKAAYAATGIPSERAQVVPFLYDMPSVLRQADLVVARSGAVTLAELTLRGVPSILVPLPTSIYGHQEQNARVLEAAGACMLMLQHTMTGERLADVIGDMLEDTDRLAQMGRASKQLGRADAAEVMARECLTLVGQA